MKSVRAGSAAIWDRLGLPASIASRSASETVVPVVVPICRVSSLPMSSDTAVNRIAPYSAPMAPARLRAIMSTCASVMATPPTRAASCGLLVVQPLNSITAETSRAVSARAAFFIVNSRLRRSGRC